MRTAYSFNYTTIAQSQPTAVDLLINFKADSAAASRCPLNLSLVIDRSGSMAGAPLNHAINAARSLIGRLQPDDIISIVTYDDTIATLLEPRPATDPAAIQELLKKIKAGGCTDLNGGWQQGCQLVKKNFSADKINRVLLLTDGQSNSGVTDSKKIIKNAEQAGGEKIATTTLGFGSQFNEDLLIGMAHGSGGNFYYIQSHDEAEDVFRIELESITAIIAQDLVVSVHPVNDVAIASMLNNYRAQKLDDGGLRVTVGDIYGGEDKLLALELNVPAQSSAGAMELMRLTCEYRAFADGGSARRGDDVSVKVDVDSAQAASAKPLNEAVVEQINRLRIARAKDEAVELADQGDLKAASAKLRGAIENIKLKLARESYEIAEEMEQLDHYAHQLENRRFDSVSRKEMRDQSYQARARNRSDLKLRGVATGSAVSLDVVSGADQGVMVQCFREGGKLRVRVISDGYNKDFNVQFPRNIRQEGITYVVEQITTSSDGSFYRAGGKISRLVLPGQPDPLAHQMRGTKKQSGKAKAAAYSGTAADLETTDTVGDGVLVQCVKEGSKLRARVVSDGFDPNFNMRFPKSIREEGILYVVDEVIPGPGGTSYIACGKIRRLIQ